MAAQPIHTTGETLVSTKATAAQRTTATIRLLYIDNIRTFLTILVLLHHLMITYAGSGSWIYTENQQDLVTGVIGSIFCGVNQAFFMGLFLLISAYFVPGAYDFKGLSRFLKDRLIRLGIPLAIYSWVIHPLYMHWFLRMTEGMSSSFWSFYTHQYFQQQDLIGQGPLWFVETLLIFTFIYVSWRLLSRKRFPDQALARGFPNNGMLALFALGIAYLDREFNFIRVNDTYASSAGHSVEYFIGKNHFELYPHAENQAIFHNVLDTGQPFSVLESPFEYPEFPERGVTYWDWRLHPVKGFEGEVQGLVLSLVDVTERKQAELQLERQNEELRELSNAERKNRELAESLVQATITVNQSLELEQVLSSILEQIRKAIGFCGAGIILIEAGALRLASYLGFEAYPRRIAGLGADHII
jgi:PAS domain S-box-containing protein